MILLDIAAGDAPAQELLPAVLEGLDVIEAPQSFGFILEEPLSLPRYRGKHDVTAIAAPTSIGMDEEPLKAIRSKRETPLTVGLSMLKRGEANAFVSSGNTGALLATAVHILGLEQGVRRPGLLARLPTSQSDVALIDVGATLVCCPDHLLSFAKLGIAYRRQRGLERARVGLLNIGAERYKGKAELIEAHDRLQKEFGEAFIGNIEPRDLFKGGCDVVVTDGFTGNMLLKTAEGMAAHLHDHLTRNLVPLGEIAEALDYTSRPGALLAGVRGKVMKCHGAADAKTVLSAISGVLEN